MDPQHVEQQLHAQAGRARQAFTTIAERAQVQWSFHVTRGRIASELLTAALGADLVILGKAGWSGQRRLGSTARAILSQAPGSTLILQHGVRLGRPVLVVYDGSRAAQRALAAAIQLVRGKEGCLSILVLADGSDAAQRLQREVTEWLRERRLEARYRWLSQADVSGLCHVVRTEGSGMLVLHRDIPLLEGEALVALLNEVQCPVLLVQ